MRQVNRMVKAAAAAKRDWSYTLWDCDNRKRSARSLAKKQRGRAERRLSKVLAHLVED